MVNNAWGLPDSDIIDQGSGATPVVMSHGTLLDRTMFDHQVQRLSENRRTIAYTSRAGTTRFGTEESVDDLVEDCLSIVDDAQVGSFVLLGMSVGGFMAIEFALRYPERVCGLVLMATQAPAYTEEEKARYRALVADLGALPPEAPIPETTVQGFTPVIFGTHSIANNPRLVGDWQEKWRRRPARSLFGEFRSWIDKSDRLADLNRIQVPTLVIHGLNDNGIGFEQARLMSDHLRNPTLVPIPEAGHNVAQEQPEAVTDALLNWLDRQN